NNVISITPPGRPPHNFRYTTTNLLEKYVPPDVGVNGTLTITHNLDGKITQLARPDGTIEIGYDNAGRLSTIMHSRGFANLVYEPFSGNLMRITSSNGVTTTYHYDGNLL